MQNTSHAAWKKLSALLILPLLAVTMLLLAECKPANNDTQPAEEAVEAAPAEPVYDITVTDEPEEDAIEFGLVEVKPSFQDGDANEFSKWVNQNLKYPDAAKEAKLQGRVTLQFTVGKDGTVSNVKVLRGVDPILDNEAVKVVSQSPKWNPGMQKGEPVNVTYVFPVVFQLR